MNQVDENGRIKPRIFGAPLEEILKRENSSIPSVLDKSIKYLIEKNSNFK